MTANKVPVAIQLYSVRDVMAEDVAGNLKRLAAMGYAGVEFAGYYNLSGQVLKELLDEAGLRCAGSHTGMQLLEGDAFESTVDINRELGNRRLIIPSADLDELDKTIDRMNAIHQRAKACGMQTGFHNHTKEFEIVDGATKFDRIFSQTPDDFLVQIDIGWATAAAQDVPTLLRKYAHRIETVHVKEFNADNPAAVVGDGQVDWPSVMTLLEKESKMAWYVVEQEKYAVGSMDSARECIQNIREMGR
jgi:sugar phosphate isomerase/epimerase